MLKRNLDAKVLSTKVAGGFVSCMYALYATSLRKQSDNQALFHWFTICNQDTIYPKLNFKIEQ
ncbi:MAG: hypothetical protein GTN87_14575 [Hydrotalea flava]|nr:hypothetical protein [Hydrotalea flava]NIS94117.1 hypothetical protein [Hydrotalea flava]